MPQAQPQVFEACLSDALSRTRDWMPRWLDQVQAGLRERELTAPTALEKQALATARLALAEHRERVLTQYLVSLADALHIGDPDAGRGQPTTSFSFDDLELMGDDQVQEAVELARVMQVVSMTVEEHEGALVALLCGALGLREVRPEAVSLQADVFVRALMDAFKRLQISPAARSRWLQAGAMSLGAELAQLFTHLAQQLERAGVKTAAYVVSPPPTSPSRLMASSGGREAAPLPTGLSGEGLLTLDHLHQLLVGNLDRSSSSAETGGMARSLAGEVVSLMLQQIAADKRLLQPIREMLMGMKPALLALARNDPRFFADRQNPARRLLDAITEGSLAYTSELDDAYAGFAREVRAIVQALLAPGDDLSERFQALLERLKRYQVETAPPDQMKARGQAMQTLVKVEQRKLLAERVANEFRARQDYPKAPGVVRRFLTGPWAQVVAHARMADSAGMPLTPADSPAIRYTDILGDLLWSSQLALASLNRPRLVKIIPRLLRTLREGLDSIGYPREQSEAFFQALMGLHEAAYKTQRIEQPADDPSSRHSEEDAALWMQSHEAQETNFFHDSAPAESTQPAFADTLPMQRDWADVKADLAARTVTNLVVGSWFDMWNDGLALRCQLTWASPHGTLFLFTTSNGRSMSMTRRSLDRLVEQDRLRLIAAAGVVDEALDAVARQALLNSGKSGEA